MDFLQELQQNIQYFLNTYATEDQIEELLQGYRGLGAFLGILLPMLEAFLPILPLVAFVLANAAAYGFFIGFLLSWAGSCIGSIVVFLFFRKLAQRRLKRFLKKRRKVRSMLRWVERGGFGPLFIALSIPFTPSSVINVVSGLSNINPKSFYLAVLLGKAIMVGIVSYFGEDWQEIIKQPARMIAVIVVFSVLWIIGKTVEKRMNNQGKKDDEEDKDKERIKQ